MKFERSLLANAAQFQRFASGSVSELEIRTAQVGLLYLGYSPGKIDAIIGPRTRGAITSFRVSAGLSAGDRLDRATYSVLCKKAGIRP
jgi:peptidoglycan hydrolase-like protein with peptidoglycan-binding domain